MGEKMNYTEKALELYSAGYNCAQAVACAFCDKVGMDEITLYKIAEGFGAGMGNRNNVCGALSGAVMIAGLLGSNGDTKNSSKLETYKLSGSIEEYFREKCKATDCCDIKGLKDGNPTVSCDECIRVAVKAVEEVLLA